MYNSWRTGPSDYSRRVLAATERWEATHIEKAAPDDTNIESGGSAQSQRITG